MQAFNIETSLSYHQHHFCTRIIKGEKPKKRNYLKFHSMKNLSTKTDEEALDMLIFPDYENFSCVNKAYSDLSCNKVTPIKAIRVKDNTNEWFDREIAEKNSRPRQIV